MHKESREQAWKATSKARTKPINEVVGTNANDADIVNLNKDSDFVPFEDDIEIEEQVPLTEEEKKEVRKKLFILLVAIVIALIIMIIMLIFDPFSSKKDDKDTDKSVVEEKEKDDENEEAKTLKEASDGSISLGQTEVVKLIEIIEYNAHDYMFNDVVSLYKTVPISISKMSNKNKLFLTSKSDAFKDVVLSKVVDDNICGSELNITTSEMNELVKEVLNTELTEHITFNYSYYNDNSFVKDIQFVKQNDLYIGKCLTNQPTPTAIVQQQVISATKENKKLHIDVKTVFANQSGVYKDPNFKTLITNDKNQELDDYIANGNTYRHTFDISNDNYYLESISLLK